MELIQSTVQIDLNCLILHLNPSKLLPTTSWICFFYPPVNKLCWVSQDVEAVCSYVKDWGWINRSQPTNVWTHRTHKTLQKSMTLAKDWQVFEDEYLPGGKMICSTALGRDSRGSSMQAVQLFLGVLAVFSVPARLQTVSTIAVTICCKYKIGAFIVILSSFFFCLFAFLSLQFPYFCKDPPGFCS